MIYKVQAVLLARMREATRRPDRGLETLEYVAWAAGIIVVVGGLLFLVRNSLETFWNSIDFVSVLP
ncbi:hypothetical protein EDC02_7666 [Micromonospora sp. Llam0]|uniref:hypothetical protein n=1 Tax=Micromonospora sp. Llam0 TaxID=2485143 RepID=UPI000F4953A7|nr:hypothetical protein [Micromonospora sp. Llam0]ROO52725.1 hypothetical protein EDC02_7666 [Micromonospora sp. Llam0]